MTSDQAWRGRTALVIGASGFVGRWLSARLLENGADVIGYCRHQADAHNLTRKAPFDEQVTCVLGSVADRALLRRTMREYSVDTVFHLAAQAKVKAGWQSPVQTFDTNIQGTWNVLDAALEADKQIRVIIASTEVVYADTGQLPHTEDSPVIGSSPYAASKLCAEVLARSYHQTYGLPVCIARTSNVYGGGDASFERIIPGTICAALRDEHPVIRSHGQAEREYLYVEDAVAGYLMLGAAMQAENIPGQIYNFTSGTPVSVLTIVETILRLMGKKELTPRVLGEKLDGAEVRHASSAKASRQLGWRAETSLEDGLMKTISWYQSHAHELLMEAQS